MNRRKLLTQISAAIAGCQIPAWATGTSKPTAVGVQKHFDLTIAKTVKEKFLASEEYHRSYDVLGEDIDLTEYSTSSLEALEYLTSLNGVLAYIGLESITPEMAKVLSEWQTYFLSFPRLKTLHFESARHLGSAESAHGLDFSLPMNLDAAAAKAVVCNGSPMHLTLQDVPDLRFAMSLATHPPVPE